MFMERIEATRISDAEPRKLEKSFIIGIAVVGILVPYLIIRIGLSGLNMFAHTAAKALAVVGEVTLRELRRVP